MTGKCFVDDALAPVPEADRAALRETYRAWWMENPTGKSWRRKAAAAAGESGMRTLVNYAVPWLLEEDAAMRDAVLDAMARLTNDPTWTQVPTASTADREAARDRAYAAVAERK